MVRLSRQPFHLFHHNLDARLTIKLRRSTLGTKLGSFSCISMVLGPFCFDTSFHNSTGRTTANWLLEFKFFSTLLLLHRDSKIATKPSRTLFFFFFLFFFEALYYQRKESRIHFVRHSIHLLTHITPETVQAGPPACYAQWTMETAIGNLGREIRQDKDFFRNIEECGVLRAQINSVMAMYPELEVNHGVQRLSIYAHAFLDGYAFLPRCDNTARAMADLEYSALMVYWQKAEWPNRLSWPNRIVRWGCLALPNGQRAQSIWCELSNRSAVRWTSCVEVSCIISFTLSHCPITIPDWIWWENAHCKCVILFLPTI